jgi:hypothetical protein
LQQLHQQQQHQQHQQHQPFRLAFPSTSMPVSSMPVSMPVSMPYSSSAQVPSLAYPPMPMVSVGVVISLRLHRRKRNVTASPPPIPPNCSVRWVTLC